MSSDHLRVGTFHLAIIASVAILLFMLGAYGT
jgi:Sec-independent protein translocase protein TatA